MVGGKELADGAELARDLGMDSLMRLELQFWIEQEFAHPVGTRNRCARWGTSCWRPAGGPSMRAGRPSGRCPPSGSNVPACPSRCRRDHHPGVFLAQAARNPGRAAVADQTGGVRTYRDLVTVILALRPALQAIPGPYVGIMLPASGGAAAAFLAVACAGKVPVMVNWSTGIKNMVHGLDLLGVAKVLTAGPVVARIQSQGMDLGPLGDRLLPLERVGAVPVPGRQAAGLGQGPPVLGGTAPAGARNRRGPVHQRQRDPAQGGAPDPREPPGQRARTWWRSTGCCPGTGSWACCRRSIPSALTATVVLPLCAGIKAVYHPVPTDGGVLARHVEAYGATLLVGTPTFLGGIVRAAADEQLKSLRFVITGAEKCPEALFAAIDTRWPGMRVLEGYGITECSPVVAGTREEEPARGTIGRPLPSLAAAVVDLETGQRVAPGAIGMLLVRGPSVFGGYLAWNGPQPFVAFEGHTWYRTGDLVRQDPRGNLVFAGRLKRFVKLGGEMVSLPAVEETLLARFGRPEDQEPALAVEALETEGRADLVLFTVRPIARADANAAIRDGGPGAHPQHPAGEEPGEDPLAGHRQDRLPRAEGHAGTGRG